MKKMPALPMQWGWAARQHDTVFAGGSGQDNGSVVNSGPDMGIDPVFHLNQAAGHFFELSPCFPDLSMNLIYVFFK